MRAKKAPTTITYIPAEKKQRRREKLSKKESRKNKEGESNTEVPRAEMEVARERELDDASTVVENQFSIDFVDGDQNSLKGERI